MRTLNLRRVRLHRIYFVALAILAMTPVAGPAADVDFAKQIAPLFERHCLRCHGATKQEGGLRLDQRAAGIKGGDNYAPAIKPGKSSDSPLFQFISREDADLKMPPKGAGLSPPEIELIKQWIDQGATWPADAPATASASSRHWSFQPLGRPRPEPSRSPRSAGEIDEFVASELTTKQLTFAAEADRATLIRRLYLVVLGLPPTPEEVGAFEQDVEVDAWSRLVDRALASPRYGERWAQHWLDLVRFGETNGFETNRERPTAWHYRDYVVDAFNSDKPYDAFVREQIAGDTLGDGLGTGFLVAGPYDLVKSQDVNLTLMQRQDELADMINTTGTAFLGLTIGCARCHNHKFDPITQRDYYAWQAVFAGVQHAERALPVPARRTEQLASLDRRIDQLARQLAPFVPAASTGMLLLDDAQLTTPDQRGVQQLAAPRGEGTNPSGTEPGFAQDPGSDTRSPNLSGGKYSWWDNKPEVDVLVYRPRLKGPYRVWLSWGAGFATHATDAQFILDRDGDLTTQQDQQVLATVDQRYPAGQTATKEQSLADKPLWSGFHNAGTHELTGTGVILVRGGKSGTAITADALAFEAVVTAPAAPSASPATPVDQPKRPAFREPVQARQNVERIAPTQARLVRFTILATNAAEPCLDELETYAGSTNVALASRGTKVRCSSSLPGYPIHKLEHVNDGQPGNDRSWISNEAGAGWVELEFPQVETIDRIVWGRDRNGQFRDRVATRYRVEVATDAGQWRQVASSDDRLPASNSPSTPSQPVYRFDDLPADVAERGGQWLRDLESARRERAGMVTSENAYLGVFQQPGPTRRLFRGDPMAPREEVGPDTISLLGKLDLPTTAPERERRSSFAHWLANAGNPLTARVWANRLWQFQFGRGLVDTPNDFGANGVSPSHPQLLDALASELIQQGWSTKHVQRQILLSTTWRQDSRPTREGLAADAGCQLWWRFPPRRLEGEAIRDSVLAASGLLDYRAGGPGFDGFDVQYENVRHYFPKTSFGPQDWRRMIYMKKVRMEKEATFGVFDCPDASQAVARRNLSTTPLQALNLLNSDFMQQQAELLAERLEREAGRDAAAQARRAFWLCWGREPLADECASAAEFIAAQGLRQFCRAVFNSNEFLFIP